MHSSYLILSLEFDYPGMPETALSIRSLHHRMMEIRGLDQNLCCYASNRTVTMKGIPDRSLCCCALNQILRTKGIPGQSLYCCALNRIASMRIHPGRSLYCCVMYQTDQMVRIQGPGRSLYCCALSRIVQMCLVVGNHLHAHWKNQTLRSSQNLVLIPRGNCSENCPS